MIRLVIVGAAGRMGRRLLALSAADPEFELAAAVDAPGHPELGRDAGLLAGVHELGVPLQDSLAGALGSAHVVIDFSSRDQAFSNFKAARSAGCGFVLGTTGLTEEQKAQIHAMASKDAKLVFAPNFSIGINLLFILAGQAARALGDDYDIEVVEMHHNQKLDAPSGTAERLGEILAEARNLSYADNTCHGRQGQVGKRPQNQIGMHALRGGDVVGDHSVIFATGGERIELTHRASSRDTFVRGALRAAKFLATAEPGDYTMAQVLGLDDI